MAIAFDNSSIGALVNPGVSSTWTHTCNGSSNLILWVSAFTQNTGATISATCNGSAMTLVDSITNTGGKIALLMFVGPNSGSNTVVVNSNVSTIIQAMATSYTGASQTGQPDSHSHNIGTSASATASTTVVASNCWLVMAEYDQNGSESNGTGTTIRQNPANGITIEDSNGVVATGSQSLAVTLGASTNWGVAIASFAPAPAATSSSRLRMMTGIGQ